MTYITSADRHMTLRLQTPTPANKCQQRCGKNISDATIIEHVTVLPHTSATHTRTRTHTHTTPTKRGRDRAGVRREVHLQATMQEGGVLLCGRAGGCRYSAQGGERGAVASHLALQLIVLLFPLSAALDCLLLLAHQGFTPQLQLGHLHATSECQLDPSQVTPGACTTEQHW